MRVLDLFAVSERLFEGYLFEIGLDEGDIERIVNWRDGLLRRMALRYDAAPSHDVINSVRATSYQGKQPFEEALAQLFRSMGFEASRDGVKGKKDVLVIAPIGEDAFRFTVEAKGSTHAVANDDAETGSAAAHRVDAEASLAVIVARKFAGFDRVGEDGPAILNECEALKDKETELPTVTIAEVETLVELFQAVSTFHYPLSVVYDILRPIESPEEKLAKVRDLQYPMEHFDFRGVLEAIWAEQQGGAYADAVSYRTIWQSGINRWGIPNLVDFERRLIALESLAGGLIRVSTQSDKIITLLQHPNIIAEHIQQAVEKRAD